MSLPASGQAKTSVFIGRVKPGVNLSAALSQTPPIFISRVFPFSSDLQLASVYRLEMLMSVSEADLRSSGAFVYVAEEAPVAAADIITNDPKFSDSATDLDKQWWLAKTGVLKAWETTTGSKSVTVAIVDTGLNGKHEDLADGRVGGGYLSYCQVAGVAAEQCLVHISATVAASENTDDNGHGTIVAGIIGAIANNNKGIAGINWNVRLLPIKVLDSSGTGLSSDVAAGIVWATDAGADIINLSLGGMSSSGNPVLNQAITYAYNKGVLVVAAAGNDSALVGSDLDIQPVYPVCNDGPTNMVLGVAALDREDKKAAFSNFGRGCIDVSAPGTGYFITREDQKGLISTYYDPSQPTKNSLYVFASGTSIGAPIVSGIGALVLAQNPDLAGPALRDRLIAAADSIDGANSESCLGLSCTGRLGSGRINAVKALSTSTFISDSLITDSSGNTYLIENGLKRAVSEFVAQQRGLNRAGAKAVSLKESELLVLGSALPPLDGTLVKANGLPAVYLVERGILQPLSLLSFRSLRFQFTDVKELPESEIGRYRLGRDLPPANGVLMKLSGKPAVYILHEEKRRLLSAFVFRAMNLSFGDVVEVDETEFSRYPSDDAVPLVPPPDGTLLKSESSPVVYVVEAGRLRPLSARAFAARGYQSSQVRILSKSEIEFYRLGEDIQ